MFYKILRDAHFDIKAKFYETMIPDTLGTIISITIIIGSSSSSSSTTTTTTTTTSTTTATTTTTSTTTTTATTNNTTTNIIIPPRGAHFSGRAPGRSEGAAGGRPGSACAWGGIVYIYICVYM